MLLRLMILVVGSVALPVMVVLALALPLAQWRSGESMDPIIALAPVGVILCAWIWRARRRADQTGTLMRWAVRASQWGMVLGAIAGAALGAKVHLDYVSERARERDDLARSVCHELKLDAWCRPPARACVPWPHTRNIEPEDYRACIEARLAR